MGEDIKEKSNLDWISIQASKSDLECIQQMRQGAESMVKSNKNAILWIEGDLNLPDRQEQLHNTKPPVHKRN